MLRRSIRIGSAISSFTRSKSSIRNSFHSVTITSASAPSQTSYGVLAQAQLGKALAHRLHGRRVVGAHLAPSFDQAARMSIAGASRTSSVSGLNESPRMPTVFPADVAIERAGDLLEHASGAASR